ncbi:MAG: GIY-YIG nuclease family protein [Balneolaceae bacterium]
MHHVYVLHSPLYDKIYIGESSDLGVRFIYHNQGPKKGWTSKYRPWVLVHMEEVPNRSVALKREKQLKSAAGRRWIWSVILKRLKDE